MHTHVDGWPRCEQMLIAAKQHSCFHCQCQEDSRTLRAAVDSATRHTWGGRQQVAMRAMTTGKYGTDDDWRKHIKNAAPILKADMRHGDVHVTVENRVRYDHCSLVTGVIPEHNPLWNSTVLDFNQMCRDDELHQMRLGMMPHIMAAVMSKITETLHPAWALPLGVCPGVAGMVAVWHRLTKRLQDSKTTMTVYVTHCFVRAFLSRQAGYQFKFALTGHECEAVFLLFVQTLPGLIEEEVKTLCDAKHVDPNRGGVIRVVDPVPEIITMVCGVLSWYMSMKMQAHTSSQVCSTCSRPQTRARPVFECLPVCYTHSHELASAKCICIATRQCICNKIECQPVYMQKNTMACQFRQFH